ncbi:2-oxo acid dehydrogenase subunit E2 [Streptosporangium sp. CA-135522]|uniref:2-oxo acid dehydrogenase subunit E2 n=1 Tax=Streptosporangium sp. CA-135522 TaxID=3240072 RepID=UPI003D9125CE
MADIRVPKLNNNDTEYLVVEWLVEDGRPVRAGDPVAVLETSKAADELEADESGRLHHVATVNTWIAPGAVLARITSEAFLAAAGAPVTSEAVLAAAEASLTSEVVPVTAAGAPADPAAPPVTPVEAAPAGAPVITDLARALMGELGVTVAQVTALGLHVVRRADVERLAETQGRADVEPDTDTDTDTGSHADARRLAGRETPSRDEPVGLDETRAAGGPAGAHRLSRVQRAVARAVTVSHGTIPAAYTAVKFDVGPPLARTRELSGQVRRPVGLAELFVQAVAGLHPAFPLFFASIDGDEVRPADAPRVGVTFDLGAGLYVPVVRETGSLREIADTLMRYRLAAMEGDFREKDLAGANIAVTLHTDADVVLAVPLVFPGTACALAITAPQQELVLGEDGAVTARTVANIGLAYDHRLINGRDAALFLTALRMELQ